MAWLKNAAPALVLLVVAAALYAPSIDYGFVYDDNAIILERKPAWEQGWQDFFTSRQWGVGRHAVALSFDLNRSEPLSPRPFHLTNVVLASLVAVLVLILGLAVGLTQGGAFAAALLFAVHPTHTDAVASIAGRAELMAACAVLGCLLLHIRRYSWPLLSVPAAALLFFVGLGSKESVVVLPLLLLLYDTTIGRDRGASIQWWAYLPYVAVGMAWVALIRGNLDDLGVIAYVDNPLAHQAAYERVAGACQILWHYLGLLFYPVGLVPDRSYAVTSTSIAVGTVAAAAWLLAIVVLWRARQRHPLLAFGALWFPIAFLVTSNLVFPLGTIMSERLLYLPSIGPALLAGAFVARATDSASRLRWLGWPALGALAVVLAFTYSSRARVWTNAEHYHRMAVLESPRSAKAHHDLGLFLAADGRFEEAESEFRRAVEIYPKFDMAVYYLTSVLLERNRPEQAAEVYRTYLERAPDAEWALSQLATIEIGTDQYDAAHATIDKLLELDPDNRSYKRLRKLARTLERSGGRLTGQPLISP